MGDFRKRRGLDRPKKIDLCILYTCSQFLVMCQPTKSLQRIAAWIGIGFHTSAWLAVVYSVCVHNIRTLLVVGSRAEKVVTTELDFGCLVL